MRIMHEWCCVLLYELWLLFVELVETFANMPQGQGLKSRFFGRFFGEKSVFDWVENDFGKDKSEVKKSEKNRRFFGKIRYFPEIFYFFLGSKNLKKLLRV